MEKSNWKITNDVFRIEKEGNILKGYVRKK